MVPVVSRPRSRRGFTLIELVVVLLIIATLAGLAIPIVSMLGRSADMAATANSQSELANNLQLFFTLQKRYPQGMDSLIDTAGAIYDANPASALQTSGLPFGGADGTRLGLQLAPWAIDNSDDSSGTGGGGSYRSFSRSGFDFVYAHDRTITNSNNSGSGTPITLTSGMTVAEVTGASLIAKLVPNGLIAGKQRLVALGIGPKNSAIGKTITNCPIYPGCDGSYYGRYVAVFMVYSNGERANLVAVIDSYGRTPDYTIQQFNESLPDGSRQG